MLFKLVQKSGNTKLGSMATITASRATCPGSCPHIGKCYPNRGNMRIWWDRMDSGNWGYNWSKLISEIKTLPYFTYVRYGQAGDLPSSEENGEIIDCGMVDALIKALKKAKSKGFLYTHKKHKNNIPILKKLNKTLSVNISCESIAECKKWINRGFYTVLTSDKIMPGKKCWRDSDVKVMQCPNQINKSVQCDRCNLCNKRDPNLVILFRSNKGTKIDT